MRIFIGHGYLQVRRNPCPNVVVASRVSIIRKETGNMYLQSSLLFYPFGLQEMLPHNSTFSISAYKKPAPYAIYVACCATVLDH